MSEQINVTMGLVASSRMKPLDGCRGDWAPAQLVGFPGKLQDPDLVGFVPTVLHSQRAVLGGGGQAVPRL
jgi:hypothetical protein